MFSLVLVAQLAAAEEYLNRESLSLEVFTTLDRPLSESSSKEASSGRFHLQVYNLDGLAQVESALSSNLPSEPEAAHAEALRRIARLDSGEKAAGRRAASGLAKAQQYGIDRYPAVVINGEAVVYGLTDINVARRRYSDWREAKIK